jgi:hypothetical protein
VPWSFQLRERSQKYRLMSFIWRGCAGTFGIFGGIGAGRRLCSGKVLLAGDLGVKIEDALSLGLKKNLVLPKTAFQNMSQL